MAENAIIHGFDNQKNKTFLITVLAEKADGRIHIEISDNGKGFTEEKLEYIRDGLGSSKEIEHIGIQNVYLRLNMFFDGGVEMDFYNNEQGGATLKLSIPIKNNTETEPVLLD